MIILDLVSFTAKLEELKYYSEESYWGVFYMTVIDGDFEKNTVISAKGKISSPNIGAEYAIKGEIEHNPVWGDTVVISEAICIKEIDQENYRGKRYILTKLFPSFVSDMYKALDDPYEALKNRDYENLMKIYRCGFARAVQWSEKFAETLPKHSAYLQLARYDISDSMIDKIIKYCSSDIDKAVDLVKNHPYRLMDIKGIGWKTADALALQNGIGPYSVERIEMCIKLFLKQQGKDGKSYCTSEQIMDEIIERIGEDVPDLNIAEAMHSLKDKNIIIWNKEKTKIGLKWYYDLEHQIAEHLIRLKNAPNKFKYGNWEEVIKQKESEQGWTYTPQQIDGIKMVLENQVCCVSGYGGTGKTSIIDGILTILGKYKSVTVALAGRAASRVAETTGEECMTVHKLLNLNYKKSTTDFHYETNPLKYDIIVIDEMSMIDGYICLQILKACATGTKVIFIGDIGQLESIGSCAVAADMLDSPWIPSIFLDKIHRQAQKSAIITESIKIRKGQQIIPKDWTGEETRGVLEDMVINCYTDKSNTYHNIINYYKQEINSGKSAMDVQIIVPCKQGVSSVISLNKAAQEIYNPPKRSKKEYLVKGEGESWNIRVGDKVINKSNKYDIKNSDGSITTIYNGNLGIVKKICQGYVLIDFISIGPVEVPYSHMKFIELGYAITCHSAQGSQFPVVIGGIDFSMYVMLNKELLYTMITRAEKKIYLCAQNTALRYAVNQNQITNRQTYLLEILDELCDKSKVIF